MICCLPNSKIIYFDSHGKPELGLNGTHIIEFSNYQDVISMSWGWAEDSQCNITSCGNLTSHEYVDRVNMEYVKIGLERSVYLGLIWRCRSTR